MKIIKLVLLLLAIGLGAYLLLWLFGLLFGIIASLLWYAFWIGLLAIGAGVGYKLFLGGQSEDEKPKLNEKKPTAISEMENSNRTLEAYKEKYGNDR